MGSLAINSIDGYMNPYLSLTAGEQAWGKGHRCLSSRKKKKPHKSQKRRVRDSDGGSIHPYWRCRTLKWWTTLWSSRHITLIAPISPFLCAEELLRCGKLPKAEWKGPFIMRKWHNTQIPLRWAWDGSFRALTNLQIIMKTSLSASFPSWMLKNHQWQI